ncbi:MAG: HAMP domain-containing sensor histidine kinase [Haloarculaceae archaeon]
MSPEREYSGAVHDAETVRTVGQLVKYSRELNQSETVEEVGAYALEAVVHVMDGHPSPTVVEVHSGSLRVLESMSPGRDGGAEPTAVERRSYRTGQTVVLPDGETPIGYESEDTDVVTATGLGVDPPEAALTIAASSVYGDGMGDTGVVVSAEWSSLPAVEEHHVRPLEYLADHVATAINNIRSRERLERAHNDLETRKEMIEMYDSLLRHDLGNDLQVITGYSDVLVQSLEDDQTAEYAETIRQTAHGAADLIDRVGDLVKTLEREREPTPTDLRSVLAEVVEDVEAKYGSISVEFDPDTVDCQVYAGDLLDSVFTNVLSNAAVHNDETVTVRVYTEEPNPDTVVVGFADDGSGVPAEVRDEIFEMGEKGPDSDGSGFGLGFVRALTESYGGGVRVIESDRGGADFQITLERA